MLKLNICMPYYLKILLLSTHQTEMSTYVQEDIHWNVKSKNILNSPKPKMTKMFINPRINCGIFLKQNTTQQLS